MGAKKSIVSKRLLGKLVIVHWLDVVGYINESVGEVKPAKCKTVGWLHEIKPDHIVLATSLYQGDQEGDWTALPLGMVKRIQKV